MTYAEQVRELTAAGMPDKMAHAIVSSVIRARQEAAESRAFRIMMDLEMAWDGSGLERNNHS